MQVQRILEPVFARLGVSFQARNFGQGGLGTLQNGLAASSLYGPDVDMLMWDSSMTEPSDKAVDMLSRQAILGGSKVPFFINLREKVAKELYEKVKADVGFKLSAMSSIPMAEDLTDIEMMPYAVRYLSCGIDIEHTCKEYEYDGICWIPRDDYTPETKQDEYPGGRAGWHPGNRRHQLDGRLLTMFILQALREALREWQDANNHLLPTTSWHVSEYYESTKMRTRELGPDVGFCHEYSSDSLLPSRFCSLPIQSRTAFTPRAYPDMTSLFTIMPPAMQQEIERDLQNCYQPPDVYIPTFDPPPDAINVLSVVEAGTEFGDLQKPRYHDGFYPVPDSFLISGNIEVGKGISYDEHSGFCDGSLDSFCNRGPEQPCLLRSHNDGRGGFLFDSYSGWLLFTLPRVKEGIVVLKLEMWHQARSNLKTHGWTSINNAPGESSEKGDRRRLKPPDYCDEFQFQYLIGDNVTTLSKTEFLDQRYELGKNVELLTIMDDDSMEKDLENLSIGMRLLGCGRVKVFKLTHIYWA